jgi:tetratricopeptide (TPR) repeat protein
MRRASWLALVLSLGPALSANAQKKAKEPDRPGVNGDRNDPNAYYTWGIAQLDTHPEDAADAFYWAIRLSPGWADAYYARWAALHLSEPDQMVLYYQRNAKTIRSPEVQRIDSLRLRAMQLNPFFYQKFEKIMLQHVIEQQVKRRNPGVDQAELNDAVRDYLSGGDPYTRAMNAYTQGNFPYALQEWAADLPSWKYKSFPHAERGRIFYLLGAYDSAAAEMRTAIKELRTEDQKAIVFVYESKALYEQSVGVIDEQQGLADSAREAYGRALEEDLSYAPAHIALSALDLAKKDTAAALSEMDIAAQVAPTDGFIAFQYGQRLLFAGHDAEALAQMKRAAELEPYFAEPHIFMGAIYDNAGYTAETVAEFTEFIKLAPASDARVAKAKARLAQLAADSAGHAAPAAAPAVPAKP